ncbi:MAG TPA: hypothetical protein VHL77_09350 [Ferruginibacter sp.]|nr:hypothetical protein [Ferruginibacter sp.]
MKKEKKGVTEDKAQTGRSLKKGLPIKNSATDAAKNAAQQIPGLNQGKTTRDDLFPSDGDNLAN